MEMITALSSTETALSSTETALSSTKTALSRLETVHHSWQWQLKHAIRDVASLAEALGLQLPEVESNFPLLVPLPFLARMEPGRLDDPLLLQVLPRPEENLAVPGFLDDPLCEQATTTPGLLQKYKGRVLVVLTGACAINCRYCFRRHFPYHEHQPDSRHWQMILEQVKRDESIREIILSGGDPLVLKDRHLASVLDSINRIEHVDSIRFHTRLPVVIPQRISDDLLNSLQASDKNIVFVLHINHEAEIDGEVIQAMGRLRSAGATLLNQSVLLKGVNDSVTTLSSLSRRLFEAGILPYYLHLLDPVNGAAHFDTEAETGIGIIEQLTRELPGYLVPKLVREVPGVLAKQSVHRF